MKKLSIIVAALALIFVFSCSKHNSNNAVRPSLNNTVWTNTTQGATITFNSGSTGTLATTINGQAVNLPFTYSIGSTQNGETSFTFSGMLNGVQENGTGQFNATTMTAQVSGQTFTFTKS